MPLAIAPTDTKLRIAKLRVSDQRVLQRLRELGFTESGELEIISHDPNGGSIVLIKGTRLALDRQLSSHIYVC